MTRKRKNPLLAKVAALTAENEYFRDTLSAYRTDNNRLMAENVAFTQRIDALRTRNSELYAELADQHARADASRKELDVSVQKRDQEYFEGGVREDRFTEIVRLMGEALSAERSPKLTPPAMGDPRRAIVLGGVERRNTPDAGR